MRTAVKFIGVQYNFGGFDVADIDDIKQSVVDFCVRRDFHSAAEVARIADAKVDRIKISSIFFIKFDAHRVEIQAQNFLQCRKREIRFAAQNVVRNPADNI